MPLPLNHQKLLEQLDYDPLTGVFTWKVSRNRIKKGDQAGSISDRGYRIMRMFGGTYKAHRLAWFYTHGSWPVGVIGHIDGNKDNNAINNLRDCSQQINCENKKKPSGHTQLLGVSFVPKLNKYKAQITVKGKGVYLGVCETAQEAHEVYMDYKRQHHAI